MGPAGHLAAGPAFFEPEFDARHDDAISCLGLWPG
jgi:hypothetical protein